MSHPIFRETQFYGKLVVVILVECIEIATETTSAEEYPVEFESLCRVKPSLVLKLLPVAWAGVVVIPVAIVAVENNMNYPLSIDYNILNCRILPRPR